MFVRIVKVATVLGAAVQAAVSAMVVTALVLVTLTSFGLVPMPI